MFRRVLVANRGEIAVRIIRACKLLGAETVAVYSDADVRALHVRMADRAVRIGPPQANESYLNLERIMQVAEECRVDAVHPGYGFRSEHWNFAAACEEAGITFIGPGSRTLATTGNKIDCKRAVRRAGVPIIPGSEDVVDELGAARTVAEDLGYPVLLKSAFGGGGMGIRVARDPEELERNYNIAANEAKGAFGKTGVYIEKLIHPIRHIEFQILSDGRGRIVHLGERECSIQRRHQKLIELTPSPAVDERKREEVGAFAITVGRTVDYKNAGTIEFLMAADGRFYFIEVNSRLQVEHPVTEMVTGLDLVEQQLRIAAGEGMSVPTHLTFSGAAIECRINAEDVSANFAPSIGRIGRLRLPGGPGVRVDTALYEGYEVPEYYDSLLAKVVVWGRDLEHARKRMLVALQELKISGVSTTAPFHVDVLNHQRFRDWSLRTDFLETNHMVAAFSERSDRERRAHLEEAAAVAAAAMSVGVSAARHPETPVDPSQRTIPSPLRGVAWRTANSGNRGRFYDAL